MTTDDPYESRTNDLPASKAPLSIVNALYGLLWTLAFGIALTMAGLFSAGVVIGFRHGVAHQKPNPAEIELESSRMFRSMIPYLIGGSIALGIFGTAVGILPGTRRSPAKAARADLNSGPYSESPLGALPLSPTYTAAPTMPPGVGSGVADLARVLGMISLIAWCLPIIGFPVSLAGLITGIIASNSNHRNSATVSIILNSLGLVLSIVNGILGALLYLNRMK
jgi:hypothetical protein